MNIPRRILTGSALAVLAAGLASADTIAFTTSFGPTTGATYSLSLNKFDSSLGTLTGVTLYFKAVQSFSQFSVMNTGGASQDWDLAVNTNFVKTFTNSATSGDKYTGETLQTFDTGTGTALGNCSDRDTTTVQPNSGSGCVGTQTLAGGATADFGTFSLANTDSNYGLTVGTGLASSNAVTGVKRTGTSISNYVGTGTFTLAGTTQGSTSFSTTGTNNEVLSQTATTMYYAEVDYTYTPFSSTPEPATMVLLGSALLCVGFIGRRKGLSNR